MKHTTIENLKATTEEQFFGMLCAFPPIDQSDSSFLVGEECDYRTCEEANETAYTYRGFIHRGGLFLETREPVTRAEFTKLIRAIRIANKDHLHLADEASKYIIRSDVRLSLDMPQYFCDFTSYMPHYCASRDKARKFDTRLEAQTYGLKELFNTRSEFTILPVSAEVKNRKGFKMPSLPKIIPAPKWKIQAASMNGWGDVKISEDEGNTYVVELFNTQEEAFRARYHLRYDSFGYALPSGEFRVVLSTEPADDDIYPY